jgi:Cu+-exporting ATPase|nr:heavy metal-associated domain-containing protein [Tepidibacter formicigenes]
MEKNFNIRGMTCASCSRAVERAVEKLEGIEEVSVNLATEKMEVKYNENYISYEEIIEAVSKAGYKASIEENNRDIIIPIQGMT